MADLIDRQAAIDALEDKYMSFGIFREQRATSICIDAIKQLPSAQPERKKGRWINTTQGDHYKCSCCGTRSAFWFDEENSSGWERDMSEWLSDFCPNCGAEMEVKE